MTDKSDLPSDFNEFEAQLRLDLRKMESEAEKHKNSNDFSSINLGRNDSMKSVGTSQLIRDSDFKNKSVSALQFSASSGPKAASPKFS